MSNSKIEILKDCRFYLEKLELCSNPRPGFDSLPMPSIVKNMLCIFPMMVTLVCLVRFVVISGFNLNTASGSFAISMGITQLALIYISLAVNRDITHETMCQMQNLVDYRKNFWILTTQFVCIQNELNEMEFKIHISIGCQLSQHSVHIYKVAEENNTKMIASVRKFLIIGLNSCYLPSLFVPISFLIFHFPKQEQWMLPFKVMQRVFKKISFSHFSIDWNCNVWYNLGRNCRWTYLFWLLYFVECAIFRWC